MELPQPISTLLTNLTFSQFEELDYYISELELPKEEEEKLITELGEFSLIKEDRVKKGRQCIETRIMFFSNFNIYIKETLTGPCHYKDTAIDGSYDESDYKIVEPKEKKVIDFE